jgi:hypothetical protein
MPRTPADLERTAVNSDGWVPGYELLGVIGRGGFGQVFQARQLKLDRPVAVKVVRLNRLDAPRLADQFDTEALALARCQHPNVVQVYDYGRHGGRLFLAMELLDGEDLGERLRRDGPLDERTAWLIARQAAAGLAHAAGHGVVHRDVKPGNLFLVPAPAGVGVPPGVPMVKVTDFGLALARGPADPADPPAAGAALGTPAYMAPEQHRGGAVDHRADVYALGATVYHCLAGRPPFPGPSAWDVLVQKLENAPPPLPAASPGTTELLAAMMAPDPGKRVGSYEELITRIDRVLVGGSGGPVARRRRRWRPVAALAGALVVALAAGGAWLRSAPPAAEYASTGRHEVLFDGASLERWSVAGAWGVERDDEGVAVLCGRGFARRPFAPSGDYRVTVGLDVHEAAAAEVHFAIPADRPETGRRLVLRVTRDEGGVFGTRDGDRGEFRPLGEPVPFPPARWFHDRRPYLEVQVARAGDVWAAWFRGEPAGRAADDGTPKAAEVRLCAVDGKARVDTVLLEELRKR